MRLTTTASEWDRRVLLREGQNLGIPQYRIGEKVWYGGISYPSGWAFVTAVRCLPELVVDDDCQQNFAICQWEYEIAWLPRGTVWGWVCQDQLRTEKPE